MATTTTATPTLFADDGTPAGYLDARATVSDCKAYRYVLTRRWADPHSPLAVFVMLNPSTADGRQDDPTLRRCVGFAKAAGCGRLAVVNLFALRATNPAAMKGRPDPVGPGNDGVLGLWARSPGALVVAAWGARGGGRGRAVAASLRAAGVRPHHLGLTRGGDPRHPLYVPAAVRPQPWEAPQ